LPFYLNVFGVDGSALREGDSPENVGSDTIRATILRLVVIVLFVVS
jgi:hypothetical protein